MTYISFLMDVVFVCKFWPHFCVASLLIASRNLLFFEKVAIEIHEVLLRDNDI